MCGRLTDVDAFLTSLQLDEFAKNMDTKKEIAKLIRELRPEIATRAIGRALKVPETTLRRNGAANSKKANQNNKGLRQGGAAVVQTSGAKAAMLVAKNDRVKNQQETVSERVTNIAMDAKVIGKHTLILADPPWDDEFGACDRSIENYYPTMKIGDIQALPVDDIAHDQAMLFMWATPSMIELALKTVERWGFDYRTQMIWVKPSIGMGRYARQRHEILLICRRGKHPAPSPDTLSDSVVEAPRGKHSAKPEIFHEIIERIYPDAERIELFRRGDPRQGWAAWGAEATKRKPA